MLDVSPDYTDRFGYCPGGFVLRSTDSLQRPVVSAAYSAACHRSSHRRPREDLGSAEQLLGQSPITQLYPFSLRIPRSHPSSRPALLRVAQCALVREPHLQLVSRIHWHHGQAVAERVQFRALWKVASDRTPSSAATRQSTEVACKGDSCRPPCSSPDCVRIILRWASCSSVATQLHRGHNCNLPDWHPHTLLHVHNRSP